MTSASLDEPNSLPPLSPSYFADKLVWVKGADDLPPHKAALLR